MKTYIVVNYTDKQCFIVNSLQRAKREAREIASACKTAFACRWDYASKQIVAVNKYKGTVWGQLVDEKLDLLVTLNDDFLSELIFRLTPLDAPKSKKEKVRVSKHFVGDADNSEHFRVSVAYGVQPPQNRYSLGRLIDYRNALRESDYPWQLSVSVHGGYALMPLFPTTERVYFHGRTGTQSYEASRTACVKLANLIANIENGAPYSVENALKEYAEKSKGKITFEKE